MRKSGQEFAKKLLDSKHVLKVIFKPSRKNKDFVYLKDPILPVWVKILHLSCYTKYLEYITLATRLLQAGAKVDLHHLF